jgi:hypothetical protein
MLQTSCRTSNISAIKLVYYVSKSFGLVGFTWNQGFPAFGRSNIAITCIVVHFFLIAALIFIDLHRFETEVSSILEIMIAVSKPISHTIVVTICFYHQRNICGITKNLVHWNLLVCLQEHFCTKICVVIAQLLLGITVIIFSDISEWFYMERCLIYFPRYALHTIINLSMCMVELQFVNFVLLLKQYFACVNTKLGSVRFTAKRIVDFTNIYQPSTLKTLKSLHSFYDSLCDVAEQLNGIYSPVILLDIGLSFFRSTQKLYRIVFSNLGQDSGILYPHILVYRCFHWMKFIFLIYACSSCTKRVSGS